MVPEAGNKDICRLSFVDETKTRSATSDLCCLCTERAQVEAICCKKNFCRTCCLKHQCDPARQNTDNQNKEIRDKKSNELKIYCMKAQHILTTTELNRKIIEEKYNNSSQRLKDKYSKIQKEFVEEEVTLKSMIGSMVDFLKTGNENTLAACDTSSFSGRLEEIEKRVENLEQCCVVDKETQTNGAQQAESSAQTDHSMHLLNTGPKLVRHDVSLCVLAVGGVNKLKQTKMSNNLGCY